MGVRDHLTRKDKCFQIISVHNPLAAKIANEFKFDWLSVGGYNVSGSALGLPDVGLLTLSEQAEAVRRIAAIARIADPRRRRRRLRQLSQCHAARARDGESRRVGDPHRGSGLPEEMRPHGRQAHRPAGRFHLQNPRLRRYPQVGGFPAVRPHRCDRGRRLQRSGRSWQRLSRGRRRRDLRRGADHDGAGRAACRN